MPHVQGALDGMGCAQTKDQGGPVRANWSLGRCSLLKEMLDLSELLIFLVRNTEAEEGKTLAQDSRTSWLDAHLISHHPV